MAAPAVVLKNETYDLLIGTQFLREYSGIINLRDGILLLLGYTMMSVFEEPSKLPGKRLKTCVLEYPSVVFSLKFRMHSSNLRSPPPLCPALEGVPLLAPQALYIPPGSQVIVDSQVSYKLPDKTFLELYSPTSLGRNNPHLCPGIIDATHKEPIQLLVANLTSNQ